MEKEEKRVLTLDRYEHGVVVNALNELRNDLLEEQRSTDIVVDRSWRSGHSFRFRQ